jgi:hypothetical protein
MLPSTSLTNQVTISIFKMIYLVWNGRTDLSWSYLLFINVSVRNLIPSCLKFISRSFWLCDDDGKLELPWETRKQRKILYIIKENKFLIMERVNKRRSCRTVIFDNTGRNYKMSLLALQHRYLPSLWLVSVGISKADNIRYPYSEVALVEIYLFLILLWRARCRPDGSTMENLPFLCSLFPRQK